jgi:hypothetical protein
MSIRKFEVYHGAALVKIVRHSENLTLLDREWAAYLVNDKACL